MLWKKKIAKLKAKIKSRDERKKLEAIEQAKLQETEVKNLVEEMVTHLTDIVERRDTDLKERHREIEQNTQSGAKEKSQLGKKHRLSKNRENMKQRPTKTEIPKSEDAVQLQKQQERIERRQNLQKRRREKLIATMQEAHQQRMMDLEKKLRTLQLENQKTQKNIEERSAKYDCVSAKGVELLAHIEKLQTATKDMNVLTQRIPSAFNSIVFS